MAQWSGILDQTACWLFNKIKNTEESNILPDEMFISPICIFTHKKSHIPQSESGPLWTITPL